MQEDSDESTLVPPIADSMTFLKHLEPEIKILPANLEDDIEKVEIESHNSSLSDKPEFVPLPEFPEENPNDSVKNWLKKITENGRKPPPPPPSRVVNYQDLPYMGEITLDNSKPRRGRKPKKADICHLIYKNYGTIFPGTPNADSYLEGSKKTPQEEDKSKITSSLLEKRLTQESKQTKPLNQNEPLNLCIRDRNHLNLLPEVKSEPQSDDDVELVSEVKSGTPESMSTSTPDTPEGLLYWPNTGLFIHPMALQQQLMMYQRLAGNMNYTPPPTPSQEVRKLVPKPPEGGKTKRAAAVHGNPAKRKRSAIFIPPIPTENTTNPATEVSICKFKFTGGAKPSLQEKKMLSVDSGGNFRYYSGTGDKSMRGYEFFPRETLQQQVTNSQGSSTGAFLQASGEKIYAQPPVEITGGSTSQDFLLTPELPGSSLQAIQKEVQKSKKRKSRKSIQREKLEQTFKEKGFLIQTQQLESAEGATYCKFRQLRKFTRYLFRSWKDYLPGNVTELSESEQRELQRNLELSQEDNISLKRDS